MLAVEGTDTEEVAKLIMTATKSARRRKASEAAHTSYPSLDSAMILFQSIVIGHNSDDGPRRLGETSRCESPCTRGPSTYEICTEGRLWVDCRPSPTPVRKADRAESGHKPRGRCNSVLTDTRVGVLLSSAADLGYAFAWITLLLAAKAFPLPEPIGRAILVS
jgi:hypothetical protein